jgi:hypothetical protein
MNDNDVRLFFFFFVRCLSSEHTTDYRWLITVVEGHSDEIFGYPDCYFGYGTLDLDRFAEKMMWSIASRWIAFDRILFEFIMGLYWSNTLLNSFLV